MNLFKSIKKKKDEKLIEDMCITMNEFAFNGDWDRHINHVEKHGSEEQKREDLPILIKLKEKYSKEDYDLDIKKGLLENNEDILKLTSIEGMEDKYADLQKVMKIALILDYLQDHELNSYHIVKSIKTLIEDYLGREVDLNNLCVVMKLIISGYIIGNPLTKHEIILNLKHITDEVDESRKKFSNRYYMEQLIENDKYLMGITGEVASKNGFIRR